MRRLATATVGAVLALGVGALPGFAASTSPGKNSAFESGTIQQPLEVTLQGGAQAGGDGDTGGTATLSVRVESK